MINFQKQQLKNEIKDYIAIAVGVALYSIAWAFFLLPYGIVAGAVTGLSAIIFYATKIPIENSYLVINICLLIIALKVLGIRFLFKTIFGIVSLSIILKFFRNIATNDNGELIQMLGPGQDFMSLIIGSCIMGIALAIVFLNNGSTGGTDIIAAVVNKYKDISLGRVLIIVDFCIIGSCLFFPQFGDMVQRANKVVFGLCTMAIMNFMLDYVMNARRESVQFLIFSNKYDEIAKAIGTATAHGITMLNATGWYTGNDMKVLCILAKKRESVTIFRLIKLIDPNAFVSQSSVIGVYGNGFDQIKVKVSKENEEKK